ncbi:P-loop containing nucleoside triphosphate hydrolase protein, partial [Mortierella sp. GBAus27b]
QRHFTFDHVFGTSATQEEVYLGCVKRMVDRFMEGYNVTIMAYGQTSSGKTYTMGTASTSTENRGHPSEGIIPRAMAQLFNEAKKPPPVYPGYRIPPLKTVFRVSFVELYNEDLIDLLAKGDYRPQVTIREDTKGTIYWTGVQEIVVTSVEEIIHLLWYGSQNRQTHSTEMNEKSSRSHAIFSITLRQENSKFHFVDLAGSERLKRTSAIGDRAKEGISINAGLHALGNVISALGDPSKKSSHVPYRDSKLTRLLQDSLGGNALALMIACVSPTELNLGETINTLKYANRARNIKNSSSLNQE